MATINNQAPQDNSSNVLAIIVAVIVLIVILLIWKSYTTPVDTINVNGNSITTPETTTPATSSGMLY